MASILKDFEACQLEVNEDEQLEVVEKQEEGWDPQDELIDVERTMSAENNPNAAAPGPEMEEEMKDAKNVQAERGEEENNEQEVQSGEQPKVVVVGAPQYAEDE
ncbi:unnamed protein product [Heligmosomoides polygyrus]|uniref:SH3 domain-containing protein n=1 Tax=Heligmosomoides polygyrus TaxID=6339 RepID=A0A3P7YK63_HELPZ|nr:unnamed protein product [Heligmosomoides polygyrus]